MSAVERLHHLRTFLFALAALLFAGTVAELLLAEHFDGPVQLIPFALCGLGLVMLGATWLRPARWSVLGLRVAMVGIAAGSLLGVWEHLEGNRGFALEVHPDAARLDLIRSALTGRDPLLAPGILAVAAVVAVAATFATEDRTDVEADAVDAAPRTNDRSRPSVAVKR
jgi:hypothetical protein